jgi:hypothetical protein
MSNSNDQLFAMEEALYRLGQNKKQGCLLVSKGSELITIYVQDGFVLNANSGVMTGKDAVDHALHLADASYQWIRNVQPPDPTRNIYLNIQEFVTRHGDIYKSVTAETGKIRLKATDTVDETEYRYFLVPENQPTIKHFLTKTATVLGRSKTSDLVIGDHNVSGRHCILDIHKRGLFILDLDSTNGTYVNGVFIKDGYINPGEVLELGDYRLTVNRELRKAPALAPKPGPAPGSSNPKPAR